MDDQQYIERDGVQIPLPLPSETAAFNAWLAANGDKEPYHPEQHYDMLGAFRAGLNRLDAQGKPSPLRRDPNTQQMIGGHLPDTYKLPKHPTFSVESKYYKPGMAAGKWENGQYISIPSTIQQQVDELLKGQ